MEHSIGTVNVCAADCHRAMGDALERAHNHANIFPSHGNHIQYNLRSKAVELIREICEVPSITVQVRDRRRQLGLGLPAVEDRDLVPQRVETTDHRRADEAGAAEDEYTHLRSPPLRPHATVGHDTRGDEAGYEASSSASLLAAATAASEKVDHTRGMSSAVAMAANQNGAASPKRAASRPPSSGAGAAAPYARSR